MKLTRAPKENSRGLLVPRLALENQVAVLYRNGQGDEDLSERIREDVHDSGSRRRWRWLHCGLRKVYCKTIEIALDVLKERLDAIVEPTDSIGSLFDVIKR